MTSANLAADRALAQPAPAPYRLLAAVALGTLLAPLNSTMLAVALPIIRRDLGISLASAGWLISSYLIAMAVAQPAGGRLGDQLGRERLFRWGLLAFLGFSLLAAVAPNYVALLTFRTLQAVAGAVLIPNGMGMLRMAVPADHFGRFSGLNSSAIGATAALGPLLGGAILALGSWRLLFLANIPIILLALLIAPRVGKVVEARKTSVGLDVIGLALFAGTLASITLFLNSVRSADSTRLILFGALAITVTALFAWRQRTSKSPAAEWRLYRVRSFLGASTHILLVNLAMYTTLVAIPFLLTDIQGRDSAVAGMLLACMAALQALVAPFAGAASDRFGRRKPVVVSSIVSLGAAIALVFGVSEDTPLLFMAAVLTVLGFGVGVGFVAAGAAAVESAPRALAGSAAGTQSMMRYLGSIVGVGILAGLLNTRDGTPGVDTFRLLFVGVAAMLVLSLFFAMLVRPFAPSEAEDN